MRSRSSVSRRPTKKQLSLIAAVVLLAAGIYLLITVLAASIPPFPAPKAKLEQFLASEPKKEGNRLYVPQIGVDLPILEGDSEKALEKGAWHRRAVNGNPEKGGNFILTGHRFELGWTPEHTRAKSPFYHIDKLQIGDKFYVDYNKKRFTYEVTKKYQVPRTAVEIEGPSSEPKLTLYSCDLRGEAAGREVVEARPTN